MELKNKSRFFVVIARYYAKVDLCVWFALKVKEEKNSWIMQSDVDEESTHRERERTCTQFK